MSLELMDKVCIDIQAIDYMGAIDFSYLYEPLIDASLEDKIAFVKCRLPECLIHIVTNGDFLNKERLESLKQSGLNRLIIFNYFLNDKSAIWTYEKAIEKIKKAAKLSLDIYSVSEKIMLR